MKYRVELLPKARREFAALPADGKRRTALVFDALEDDPRLRGVKKLGGSPLWRVRVGPYRIIYSISDRERLVLVEHVLRRTTTTYD